MYIINVRVFTYILPRMFAVDFELYPGDLRTTAIVLADAPEAVIEKAFQFPEYLREGCQGHIHEIKSAAIEWEKSRVPVFKREMGNGTLEFQQANQQEDLA